MGKRANSILNLSDTQAEILTREFRTATFIIDPDEAGQKLKKHVIETLLPKMPVRILEAEKQVDQMTSEEVKASLQ
jgi:DNA primase